MDLCNIKDINVLIVKVEYSFQKMRCLMKTCFPTLTCLSHQLTLPLLVRVDKKFRTDPNSSEPAGLYASWLTRALFGLIKVGIDG